jgi:hypothetical protein
MQSRPPDDFVAFVAEVYADLRGACRDLTHNDPAADLMVRDMLAAVALRWWWLGRRRRRWLRRSTRPPGTRTARRPRSVQSTVESSTAVRPDPGRAFLVRLIRYEMTNWRVDRGTVPGRRLAAGRTAASDGFGPGARYAIGTIPGVVGPIGSDEEDDGLIGEPARAAGLGVAATARRVARLRSPASRLADLATAVWQRARAIRYRRRLSSPAVLLILVCLVFASPKLYDRRPPGPPAPPLPTSVPSGVDVLPDFGDLASIPAAGQDWPRLESTGAPLAGAPLPSAKVLIQLTNHDLELIAANGAVRTVPGDALDAATLSATSLAPDGRHAVLSTLNSLVVVDVTTGKRHDIHLVGVGQLPAPVWRDPLTVLVPTPVGPRRVDIVTDEITPVDGLTGRDVVSYPGGTGADLVELIASGATLNDPARVRLWHTEPIASPLVTTPAPSPSGPAGSGVMEDRRIFAPRWLGHWYGPGFGRAGLIVRGTDPIDLLLPAPLGEARWALGVVDTRGLGVRTLATVDGSMTMTGQGWLDDQTALISVSKGFETWLLTWNVRAGTVNKIQDVGQALAVSVVS